MQKPTVIYEMPIQEKYMLSLKEAGVYFNIGIKKMRRMAELNEGGFALFNGNRWIICRPKFEEYLLKLMKSPSEAAEVLYDDDQTFFAGVMPAFLLSVFWDKENDNMRIE